MSEVESLKLRDTSKTEGTQSQTPIKNKTSKAISLAQMDKKDEKRSASRASQPMMIVSTIQPLDETIQDPKEAQLAVIKQETQSFYKNTISSRSNLTAR